MNNKILITGNRGFIGYWLSFALKMQGYKIYGIDNLSSKGKRLSSYCKKKIFEKEAKLNISNSKKIIFFLKKYKPSIVINVAGQAIVPRAFEKPVETLISNSLGPLILLDAIKRFNFVKTGIFITSDKVYENNEKNQLFQEKNRLGGKDIYSVSKTANELICKAYVKSFFSQKKNIQTIRLGNVVGGGDWSINRLIPDLINAWNKKKHLK